MKKITMLLMLVFTFSCSDNDSDIPEYKLITMVEKNYTGFIYITTYNYDSNKRLKSYSKREISGTSKINSFSYDNNGNVVSITYSNGDIVKFTYASKSNNISLRARRWLFV